MKHLSDSNSGHPAAQGRSGSLDLVMQARELRYQWLVSTCKGLSARLARFGSRSTAPTELDGIRDPRAISSTLSA